MEIETHQALPLEAVEYDEIVSGIAAEPPMVVVALNIIFE